MYYVFIYSASQLQECHQTYLLAYLLTLAYNTLVMLNLESGRCLQQQHYKKYYWVSVKYLQQFCSVSSWIRVMRWLNYDDDDDVIIIIFGDINFMRCRAGSVITHRTPTSVHALQVFAEYHSVSLSICTHASLRAALVASRRRSSFMRSDTVAGGVCLSWTVPSLIS